jgi:hypothetical protein
MKRRKLVALAIVISLLPVLGAATSPENKARSEALLNEARAVLIGRSDSDLKAAMFKAEEASRLCPDCVGPWLLLSEIYWNLGDRLPASAKDRKAAWFARGEAAGDKAMTLDPKAAGPLYWKTTNMASAQELKGWAASLWIFTTLLKNMDEVNRRDPHYYFGGTDRFWVEVLNRVPLFLADQFGYKPSDVARDLEEEIKREPRFFSNYTFAARLYWKMGQKDKALDRLNYVLSHDAAALPDYRGDNLQHQALAKKLWKEWTGKDYPRK